MNDIFRKMSSKKCNDLRQQSFPFRFHTMADDFFKEFVIDQLSALPELRAKAMFGAHGLYSGAKFFGILDEGRLFFKTDTDRNKTTSHAAWGLSPTR